MSAPRHPDDAADPVLAIDDPPVDLDAGQFQPTPAGGDPALLIVGEEEAAIFSAWASVSWSKNQTSSPFDRNTNGAPNCSAYWRP
jgi:hypothetical protein